VDISNNIKQFLDPELSFPAGVWIENEWALVPLGLNRYVFFIYYFFFGVLFFILMLELYSTFQQAIGPKWSSDVRATNPWYIFLKKKKTNKQKEKNLNSHFFVELAHNGQGELAVSRSKLLLAYLDVNPPTYKVCAYDIFLFKKQI
jgi:hypothetical protein